MVDDSVDALTVLWNMEAAWMLLTQLLPHFSAGEWRSGWSLEGPLV